MKEISIDDLPPVRVLEAIEENERITRVLHVRSVKRLFPDHGRGGLGYHPQKLLDWRHLERRYVELLNESQQFSKAFWESLETLQKHLENHGGVTEIWIPLDSMCVLVYKDHGCNIDYVKNLVDKGIPDPKFRSYVVQRQERIDALRLRERENTLRRRAAVLQSAFILAVKARLRPFVEEHLSVCKLTGRGDYYTPATFIITNDNRTYVVSSDEAGILKFKYDRPVFVCR